MTVIKKHISFDEFIYNLYLSELEGNNFSKHIQKLCILGSEALNGDAVEQKKRLISTLNENERLRTQIKELNMRLRTSGCKKETNAHTKQDIIEKYQLEQKHLDQINIDKIIMAKDPSYLRGRFSLFQNQNSLHNMRLDEYKKLLEEKEESSPQNQNNASGDAQ